MNESDQTARDLEQLKLLSVFHYILGGMLYLFGCFPIFHLVFGLLFLTGAFPETREEPFPNLLFGLVFTIFPLLLIAGAWTLATLAIVTGRRLSRRVAYKFCFVIACIECLFVPLGTILGVFSIITLNRPSVRDRFNR